MTGTNTQTTNNRSVITMKLRNTDSKIARATSHCSLSMLIALFGISIAGCGGTPKVETDQFIGQSDFQSRPANASNSGGPGNSFSVANGAVPAAATDSKATGTTTTPTRTVEETDLYRLEGDRLYYLNSYRGLMVFDVSNVDSPKLLGRSPIYGDPIEMIVRNGVASVVVSDWYGTTDAGTPFHLPV